MYVQGGGLVGVLLLAARRVSLVCVDRTAEADLIAIVGDHPAALGDVDRAERAAHRQYPDLRGGATRIGAGARATRDRIRAGQNRSLVGEVACASWQRRHAGTSGRDRPCDSEVHSHPTHQGPVLVLDSRRHGMVRANGVYRRERTQRHGRGPRDACGGTLERKVGRSPRRDGWAEVHYGVIGIDNGEAVAPAGGG